MTEAMFMIDPPLRSIISGRNARHVSAIERTLTAMLRSKSAMLQSRMVPVAT